MGTIGKVKNLTVGNPLSVILIFALPILFSNLFQQLYNLTDISIISHHLKDDSVLSAIGAVSPVYNLCLSLCFGITNGYGIVIARCFGSGDIKQLHKSVGNVITLSFFTIFLLTVTTLLLKLPVLKLTNATPSQLKEGNIYITILLFCIGLTFIYNLTSSMLRAVGNSLVPLIILGITTLFNIGLDLLFVCVFDLRLAGAAIATAISIAISAIMTIWYICVKMPILKISKSDLIPDCQLMLDLFITGLSFGFMFAIVHTGTIILQCPINKFSTATVAAHTTARKLSEFLMLPVATIATSLATFVSQNHGANLYKRISKGVRQATLLGFAITFLLIAMVFTIGDKLIYLVAHSSDSELINTSLNYLKFNILFYFALTILCNLRNVMQGLGSKFIPLIISSIELALKIIMAFFLAEKMGYNGIIICEPVIWVLCSIFIGIAYFITLRKRQQQTQVQAH